MKTLKRLWVISNIIMDVVTFVDAWPERSGDILAKGGKTTPGGAFNVIVAASRLGLETVYGGLIGTGPFGDAITEHLNALGVSSPNPRIADYDTGFDVAIVEKNGERTFITVPGCESWLESRHLAALSIEAGDWVYLSGYNLLSEPTASALQDWTVSLRDNVVLLDPGPLVAEIDLPLLDAVMRHVDIFTLNQREAFLLTGLKDPGLALTALHRRYGAKTAVVVRSGATGAWILDKQHSPRNIPARRVKTTNTTGAGDVHAAALVARMQDVPWEQAVFEANICASLAIERDGPAESPTSSELYAVLRKT